MQYLWVYHYVQVCVSIVGISIVLIQKYMQIPTHTYNTYTYRHTYLYLQYLLIPAKPSTYTVIPTYTYNTYRYI